MRNSTAIKSELTKINAEIELYKKAVLDGAEGHNIMTVKALELCEELRLALINEGPLATKEGVIAERAWFNAQGFSSFNEALDGCKERGYTPADLKKSVATFNL